MKFTIDGNEIEVPDDQVKESVKSADWYNSEIDRIKDKHIGETKQSLTDQHAAQIEELKAQQAKELADAKALASGKQSDATRVLSEQLEKLKVSFGEEKALRQKAEATAKMEKAQSSIVAQLSKVDNETVRGWMIRDAQDAALVDENGDVKFKLNTGALGSADEYTKELTGSDKYKGFFVSGQPNGSGLKGGSKGSGPTPDGKNLTKEQRIARANQAFADA